MNVSKEFKVGLLVVLGLLLLFVGVNFLKGGSLFGEDRVYFTTFSNSQGLQVSNEVQLNGLKIGQVQEIGLHPNDANLILVKYTIMNDELQIPSGSDIELISSDILGTKALELHLDLEPKTNLAYFESGDTIPGSIEVSLEEQINEELLPLKKKTEELITSVEGIIVSVNSFWDTSAAYTIDESLYEVRDAIGKFGDLANNLSVTVEEQTDKISRVLTNTERISNNLADKSDEIASTIDNIRDISDTLKNSEIKAVIAETQQTLTELTELLGKVNDGQGSLGMLLHSDSLHNELVQTNQSLQHLLDDMQANPNNYVHFSLFGRKKHWQFAPEEEKEIRDLLDK
jgi:phospholipid/cholesterol/gamma-HCH transport system substrate-binding protein